MNVRITWQIPTEDKWNPRFVDAETDIVPRVGDAVEDDSQREYQVTAVLWRSLAMTSVLVILGGTIIRDSQTGDCCLGHLTNGCPDDALPTPDATSPAQLRFVAAVIDELDGVVGLQADEWGPQNLRAMAHHIERLEAAQQQADADEELIEKAARTLAFAVERNDDDVSESEMWGMYLTPESRFRYRNQASALLAANLLRDGDQKAESGPTVEGGISNGQRTPQT